MKKTNVKYVILTVTGFGGRAFFGEYRGHKEGCVTLRNCCELIPYKVGPIANTGRLMDRELVPEDFEQYFEGDRAFMHVMSVYFCSKKVGALIQKARSEKPAPISTDKSVKFYAKQATNRAVEELWATHLVKIFKHEISTGAKSIEDIRLFTRGSRGLYLTDLEADLVTKAGIPLL